MAVDSTAEELLRRLIEQTARMDEKLTHINAANDEFREQLRNVVRTQGDHSERLTHAEAQVREIQALRTEVAVLKTDYASLKATMEAHQPVKTPWTAVMSAVVALGALAWALFGR